MPAPVTERSPLRPSSRDSSPSDVPTAPGPADDLREAAAHGVRWSAIARPTTEIIQLASIVVLARLIVPEEFGRFAIAFIVQQVAYLIVAGGLSAALVQRKSIDKAHLQTGMALALLAGIVLAALTLLGAVVIVTPVFGSRTGLFVALMAPLCVVSALNAVPAATLGREMAFRRLSEIEVLSTFARVGLSVGLALMGMSGEALVIGLIAGSVVAAAIAWVSAPPPMPRFDRAAARDLIDYSLPASLAAVTWVGFSNIDYAIIGARLGALQTGFYFRSYTLAVEYQTKVSVVMTQVGFPVLARAGDAKDLTHMSRQMVQVMTIVLFPLLVLLAIEAPVAIPFLFGPDWGPAIVPTQILALGGASSLAINAVGTVLMATGRARALLGFGAAHFAVYGVSVFAVVRLGIVAVAVDAAIVHTIFLLIAYALMLRGSDEGAFRRLWEDLAPAAISCLGLVAVTLPASVALTRANVPAGLWLLAVALVAIPPYLLSLRICFPAVWRGQLRIAKRLLPRRRRSVLGSPQVHEG
jgi:lipopolysaccharide exporter